MAAEASRAAPLARSAARGAVFLGLSQGARIALTILSTIIVSRLLSPDDYGVVAMTAPVVALVAMLQDLGLSSAAVQKRKLERDEATAIFWINVFLSIALALVLAALSPTIGRFYGDDRASAVSAVSAIGIVITSFGLQHAARLQRDMRFRALGLAEFSGALATFLATLIAALLLRSYWALLIGVIAGAAVQTTGLWLGSQWWPGRWAGLRAAFPVLSFGGHITGFGLLNFLVRNLDTVLIAKFAGAGPLGLYDRSYKLMMFPLQNLNGPLSRLLLPVLSRLQDEPERFRHAFIFPTRVLMMALLPGLVVACALSDRLVPFLLGSAWAGATPIFFWLALAGLFQPLGNLCGMLFISTGNTRTLLGWGVFASTTTVAGFVIGLAWGAEGVAASIFIGSLVRLPFLFILCAHATSVRQSDLYESWATPALGSALAVPAIFALAGTLDTALLLGIGLVLTYTTSGLASLATPTGRATLAQLWRLARPRSTAGRS